MELNADKRKIMITGRYDDRNAQVDIRIDEKRIENTGISLRFDLRLQQLFIFIYIYMHEEKTSKFFKRFECIYISIFIPGGELPDADTPLMTRSPAKNPSTLMYWSDKIYV